MKVITVIISFFISVSSFAQQAMTLKEAINFAIENQNSIKSSKLGIKDAEYQIQELKRTGLPQINGQFNYTYNAKLPTSLLPANTFNPAASPDEVIKVHFGVPWSGQAGIGLNQLLFDGSWLVGLRAADTYRSLAQKDLDQSEITIIEQVAKAYYSVLVAQERSKLLDLNIERIEALITELKVFINTGFAEQIDLNRLEVQRNNLLTEKSKTKNLIELSYKLLKFQMQMDLDKDLTLTDKLDESKVQLLNSLNFVEVNPEDRIEYQKLEVQKRLSELDIESVQKKYWPSLFFTATLGATHGNTKFNPFERWFLNSNLGIGMNFPIFDSGLKRQQIDRKKLSLEQIELGGETMKRSFDLQNESAYINLKNGLQTLEVQRRNMDLAKEVVKVASIKYKEGVGSNIEIVNAENDLRQAQTNFFSSLYDVIISKIDLDKAQGKLENYR